MSNLYRRSGARQGPFTMFVGQRLQVQAADGPLDDGGTDRSAQSDQAWDTNPDELDSLPQDIFKQLAGALYTRLASWLSLVTDAVRCSSLAPWLCVRVMRLAHP